MIKVIKDLGNNHYEVEIESTERTPGLREVQFGVAHDYAHFEDYDYLRNPDGSSGQLKHLVSVHIPIRTFVHVCLPKLINNQYCQPDHLKDRVQYETDKYNTPPTYKAGDMYPAYAYDNVAIYYWENGVRMVSVMLGDERVHSTMTAKLFDTLKKNTDFVEL